jgi:hypothetical protein
MASAKAKTENGSERVNRSTVQEHTIAVRAYDRFENVGSAKTTLRVPGAKP